MIEVITMERYIGYKAVLINENYGYGRIVVEIVSCQWLLDEDGNEEELLFLIKVPNGIIGATADELVIIGDVQC
jgi:hypothetical protein